MKKKILMICMAMVFATLSICGCGQQSGNENIEVSENIPDTIAYKIRTQFREEIKNDNNIENVANKLIENEAFEEMAMGVMPVEEGYLNGFNEEIKGFSSGVMFAPMIGTIPFVGYIFETDNPDELMKILDEKAMLNWNICTTADEKVSDIKDNVVFFVMSPYSFEME